MKEANTVLLVTASKGERMMKEANKIKEAEKATLKYASMYKDTYDTCARVYICRIHMIYARRPITPSSMCEYDTECVLYRMCSLPCQ